MPEVIIGIIAVLVCSLLSFVPRLQEYYRERAKYDQWEAEARQHTAPWTRRFQLNSNYRGQLAAVNAILERMWVEDVCLESMVGSVAGETRRDSEGKENGKWFAFEEFTLRFTPAPPDMGYQYRMEAVVVKENTAAFDRNWRREHPDQVLKQKRVLVEEDCVVLILLSHKINPKADRLRAAQEEKKSPAAAPTPRSVAPAPAPKPPAPKFPEPEQVPESLLGRFGKCGEMLTWHVEGSTLFITGFGRLTRCKGDWKKWEGRIRHVIISPGCTGIGKYAFKDHSILESIQIPDTVRTIGREAFMECVCLKEIFIPDSVNGIGHGAFRSCRDLFRVRLPEQLTQISPETFRSCTSLMELEIPRRVRVIGANAFRCCGLDYLELPDSVEEIGASAFRYCTGLREIVLQEGIKSIPAECFRDCEGLESIAIPDTVETIGRSAFLHCKNLEAAALPGCLKTIGDFAFADCRALPHLAVPDDVAEIGPYAFSGVRSIAYHGCAVSEDNWGALERGSILYRRCDGGVWYIEGDTIHVDVQGPLPTQVFEVDGWHPLVPEKITRAPWYAVASRGRHLVIAPGCTCIPTDSMRFSHHTRVTIPDTVTRIEANAFEQSSIQSIALPAGLTKIEHGTFFLCTDLASVEIPDTVTEIDGSAFMGCRNLKRIQIPDSVTKIGGRAFDGCKKLEHPLVIPDSVTQIGQNAFREVAHIIYNGPAQSPDNWGAEARN